MELFLALLELLASSSDPDCSESESDSKSLEMGKVGGNPDLLLLLSSSSGWKGMRLAKMALPSQFVTLTCSAFKE